MNEDRFHTTSPRWISALEADRAAGRKELAVLVDPDHARTPEDLAWMADPAFSAVHTVLLGGSLVTEGSMAVSYTHLPSPRDLSTSRMPSSA